MARIATSKILCRFGFDSRLSEPLINFIDQLINLGSAHAWRTRGILEDMNGQLELANIVLPRLIGFVVVLA